MYRKKIAAIVLSGLTMTTCAEPATGVMYNNPKYYTESINDSIDNAVEYHRILQEKAAAEQARLDAEQAIIDQIAKNTETMQKSIKRLEYYVGKTWYAFSGSTVRGWDCSGLVKWFYSQQGIELVHRASVQDDSGEATKKPKPGDIVVFKYNGRKNAYHVGIYIGDGNMIHAPSRGKVTRIESVEGFANGNSMVSYRTLIETN
jgi:cell wall-associated NlpC family hydrolase